MKVNIITLGCDKNLVDSEIILNQLANNGFEVAVNQNSGDIIIVNTCAFTNEAKQESIENIIMAGKLKKEKKYKTLILTGCMVQRYKDELLKLMPEVDALVGLNDYSKISEICNAAANKSLKKKSQIAIADKNNSPYSPFIKGRGTHLKDGSGDFNLSKRRLSPSHTAYVKIADGCDNRCSYCVIPAIRGSYKSRQIEHIIDEVEQLAKEGVVEINLISQDTAFYGTDIYGKNQLVKLLKKLSHIKNIKWIRLLYCHPAHISDELINIIAQEPNICKYIDLPLQHCEDEILKAMGRGGINKQYINNLIKKLRKYVKNIAIRTTFIVGFPGETDKHFKNLLEFIKDVEFERIGVFKYSKEEDTIAYDMKNQISASLKNERYNILMSTQQDISLNKNKKKIGQELEVLVDSISSDNVIFEARTESDAPEVDGRVYVEMNPPLLKGGRGDFALPVAGEFRRVKITSADVYDLCGNLL
ncbi:MAG: 30S ribosomal protein S12 methylthiotransferase RimO [Candidatus Firestonebacteria bacterium]